jgi:hypothetical protein
MDSPKKFRPATLASSFASLPRSYKGAYIRVQPHPDPIPLRAHRASQ